MSQRSHEIEVLSKILDEIGLTKKEAVKWVERLWEENEELWTIVDKNLKSKFEKEIWKYLKRKRVKFEYEAEKIPYILYCHYVSDWKIKVPNGYIYVESKGYLRPEDKRKLNAVKRQHPNLDIRILFYSNNSKYIKWATKYGFKYAIGEIPGDWLKGL